MNIGIVGAGWAGLAAAITLHRAGHDVHLYEAAAIGGRARQIRLPGLDTPVDNGQHILLGAYHETVGLMHSLDVNPEHACSVQPLDLRYLDGRLRLRFLPLPAPWHRAGIILGSRGLCGLAGRRHLRRVLIDIQRIFGHDESALGHGMTADVWLRQLGCPSQLLEWLWEPLCVAALNTPLQRTQALQLARVLRDSLAAQAADSHTLIPRATLHDLWPARACALLGARIHRHRVRRVQPASSGTWYVDDQPHEAVIVATPWPQARRLLDDLPNTTKWLATWPAPQYSAIGTLTLELQRPWGSGHAMTMLHEDPARQAWGQWLFDHSAIARQQARQRLLHVVIGQAQRYATGLREAVTEGVIRQVRAQSTRPLPEVKNTWLVTEKRATFDALPDLARPGNRTPWPGLFLAGDWTDTGYPAVLEGAVRSGLQAAAVLLRT